MNIEDNKIYLFTDNIFYQKWNNNNKNYHLLDYLLPSEDIEDLRTIQLNLNSIENYDFTNLITKYDLQDYIVSIIFKDKNELRVLSKINLNNSLKIDNQKFEKFDLDSDNFEIILEKLKNTYENYWKKNNEINTSIKLPLTIAVDSEAYEKIKELEKLLKRSDLISKFYISKFDSKTTFYKVIYNGSPKTFLNYFDDQALDISMKNNVWTIN